MFKIEKCSKGKNVQNSKKCSKFEKCSKFKNVQNLKTFKILKCSKVFYLNSKSKNVQK
jgi:hypothetical protein